MKQWTYGMNISFLVCCLLVASCNTGPAVAPGKSDLAEVKNMAPPDLSDVPDSVEAAYRKDAAVLALHEILKDPEAKTTLVEIPRDLIDDYFGGLIRLYQSQEIAECDSVTRIYRIHVFPSMDPFSILVAVDSRKEWTQAWAEGRRLTGNPEVDELMERYFLDVRDYYNWPNLQLAVLSSAHPLNMAALAPLFAQVDGVVYAEPNGFAGDGNHIEASRTEEGVTFVLSVGYGDCPSGCIYRRFWEFQVGWNGSVLFLRSYGAAPPG